MGSKEMTTRLKKPSRNAILDAALFILRNDGRQSLSLRKIAKHTAYAVPVIYSYFKNKEAILIALCSIGYKQLNTGTQNNCIPLTDPEERLIAIIATCLQFAFHEKQLYNLMWEVGAMLDEPFNYFQDLTQFIEFLKQTLRSLYVADVVSEEVLLHKSQTVIALIHGHICLPHCLTLAEQPWSSKMLYDTIRRVIGLVNA